MADFRALVAAVAAAGGLDRPLRGSRPLDEVCIAFAADLPVDGVSMSVLSGSTVRETVGSSGVLADGIEDQQYALGVGPCYDAFARGGPVLVSDVQDPGENRWPAFSTALGRTPVRAVFAFPMRLGGIVVGAVDTYRTRPGLLDAVELRDVLRAVDLLVVALASARGPDPDSPVPVAAPPPPGTGARRVGEGGAGDSRAGDSRAGDSRAGDSRAGDSGAGDGGGGRLDDTTAVRTDEAAALRGRAGWENFLDALPSDRVRVHQATGMVIGQLGGTPEQALARIRAHAFAEGRSIIGVAGDIVARRLTLAH